MSIATGPTSNEWGESADIYEIMWGGVMVRMVNGGECCVGVICAITLFCLYVQRRSRSVCLTVCLWMSAGSLCEIVQRGIKSIVRNADGSYGSVVQPKVNLWRVVFFRGEGGRDTGKYNTCIRCFVYGSRVLELQSNPKRTVAINLIFCA